MLEERILSLENELKVKSIRPIHNNYNTSSIIAKTKSESLDIFNTSVDPNIPTSGIPFSFISLLKCDKYSSSLALQFKSSPTFKALFKKNVKTLRNLHFTQSGLHRLELSEIIKKLESFLSDDKLTRLLLKHFFNSELFLIAPFIDKDIYIASLTTVFENEDFKFDKKIFEKGDLSTNNEDFNFSILGILLTIMRISSINITTCGFDPNSCLEFDEYEYLKNNPVSHNILSLIMNCFIEVKETLYPSMELLQFSLMVQVYKSFSPEFTGSSLTNDKVGFTHAFRIGMSLGLNVEPKESNVKRDLIKKIWYHLLDVDFTQFLDSGIILAISEENYTTEMPKIESSDMKDYSIREFFYQRNRVRTLIEPFPKILSNFKQLPSILFIEGKLNELLKYITTDELNHLLLLKTDSTRERISKIIRILNYLDIYLIHFTLNFHIFSHYDKLNDDYNSTKFLMVLIKQSNLFIQLMKLINDYDDSMENVYIHLRKIFGFHFQIVPKILTVMHRVQLFQTTFMGRLNYYINFLVKNNNNSLITIKILKDLKVLTVDNFKLFQKTVRNFSNMYSFAKRIEFFQTILIRTLGPIDAPLGEKFYQTMNDLAYIPDSFLKVIYDENSLKKIKIEFESFPNLVGLKDIVDSYYPENGNEYGNSAPTTASTAHSVLSPVTMDETATPLPHPLPQHPLPQSQPMPQQQQQQQQQQQVPSATNNNYDLIFDPLENFQLDANFSSEMINDKLFKFEQFDEILQGNSFLF